MLNSYFRNLHPWTCVVYLGILAGLVMTTSYDYHMLILFLLIAVQQILHQEMKKTLQLVKTTCSLVLIFGVFNMLFNHNGSRPLLYINDVPLTLDALYYGMFTGIMVSCLLLWFQIFQNYIDNHKMTYMLGRYLPVTALILSMVFCYTDKFMKKIDKIREVWNSYKTKEGRNPMKQAGIIWTVLLSVMLEDSVETALSMKARGYGNRRTNKTRYIKYLWTVEDLLVILGIVVLFLLYLIFVSKNQIVLLSLVMIPTIFDMYKEIQWKLYQSKI